MSYELEAIEAERLDADIETANLVAEGVRIGRLHQRGICTHGWRQGFPSIGNKRGQWPDREQIEERRKRGQFPDRPTNYDTPPEGYVLCLDCGQHVPRFGA
jgi:hypothetical protein